jgi:pimeloyl-ACP methyl ester carboxylesterase
MSSTQIIALSPISNDRTRPIAIDIGFFAAVHGVPQWVAIRGADRRNPALLLVGGPGFGYAAIAPFFAEWERDFTLVYWDQPGAGFTFGKNGDDATGPLTIDRLARDGVRVAELACTELGASKVALVCISGGTIVGLDMVQRQPALFSAYVGTGQVVDWRRQDELSYAVLLERAHARSDAAMLAELTAIGAPPYPDTATDARKSKYAGEPTAGEGAAFADLMPLMAAALQGAPADAAYFAPGLQWPEPRARATAAYDALRGEIVRFDARRLPRRFDVPMFFFQGADDTFTMTADVQRYAAEIDAPHVEFAQIEGGGHSAVFLRREFLALLVARVRPTLPLQA